MNSKAMRPPRLLILTGAGISQESGLATFRDRDGAWAKIDYRDVATPEAFTRNPARVQAFYNARRAQLREPGVAPNPAHLALARLEQHWPTDCLIVTQNVDDLHERAGSRNVLHMHGQLRRARCLACKAGMDWDQDLDANSRCHKCQAIGSLRPDIVWFGETPKHMDLIELALTECQMFISIGTSGSVYPAAGFIAAVRGQVKTVELNLAPSETASLFDRAVLGKASEIVPRFVDELLARLP